MSNHSSKPNPVGILASRSALDKYRRSHHMYYGIHGLGSLPNGSADYAASTIETLTVG